jgi:hypothetical protein
MLAGKTRQEVLPDKHGLVNELLYSGLSSLDGDKNKTDPYDHEGIDKTAEDMKKDMDRVNLTNDSGSKVSYKQCGTCNGIGWVK